MNDHDTNLCSCFECLNLRESMGSWTPLKLTLKEIRALGQAVNPTDGAVKAERKRCADLIEQEACTCNNDLCSRCWLLRQVRSDAPGNDAPCVMCSRDAMSHRQGEWVCSLTCEIRLLVKQRDEALARLK
jgi:hypothetical protein